MLIERKDYRTSVKAMEVDFDRRTVVGYFATWDLDRIGDTIDQRAFEKTFRERGPRYNGNEFLGSRIKMDFNHECIVGVPARLETDSKGAIYHGMVDATPLGDVILTRVASKSLDVNSFTFDVLDDEAVQSSKVEVIAGGYQVRHRRHLKELRLHAVGPVDEACNEAAMIAGVKSLFQKDPDTWFRLFEDLKAGRRLSSASMALLDIALTALSELQGPAGAPGEDDDPPDESPPPDAEPEDGNDQDEQKALADTLRGLRLFKKG